VIAWLVPARLNHPGMYEVEEGEVMEIATLEGDRHYADTPSGPVSYLDIGEGHATVFIHGVITNSLSVVAPRHIRGGAGGHLGHRRSPAPPALPAI
jgi:hypothetical protein